MPTNAIKSLSEGNISTCSTNRLKKPTNHTQNQHRHGWGTSRYNLHSATPRLKRGTFFGQWGSQGALEAAPGWQHAAEAQPTAPSNIQLHTRMWSFKSLQPSWAGIINSSSSGCSLLALDKTSGAEDKTHSCEKYKFPHEEQVLSCAHEDSGVPLPVV